MFRAYVYTYMLCGGNHAREEHLCLSLLSRLNHYSCQEPVSGHASAFMTVTLSILH